MSKPNHITTVNLTEDEAGDLLNGKTVILTTKHFENDKIPIILTKTQLNGLVKAVQSGSGFPLTFSPAQHALHTSALGMEAMRGSGFGEGMEGFGFWSRAWRRIKKIAKGAWKVIRPFAKAGIDIIPGAKEAIGAVGNASELIVKPIANSIKAGSGDAIANAVNKVQTDLTTPDAVSSAIVDVYKGPQVTPQVATPAITGSGLRRKLKTEEVMGEDEMRSFRDEMMRSRQSGKGIRTSDGRL